MANARPANFVDLKLLLRVLGTLDQGEKVRPALLLSFAVTVDFEGVAVRILNLEGLLKTKQGARDKDRLDRLILERALNVRRT